jgi:hypothetical protein
MKQKNIQMEIPTNKPPVWISCPKPELSIPMEVLVGEVRLARRNLMPLKLAAVFTT